MGDYVGSGWVGGGKIGKIGIGGAPSAEEQPVVEHDYSVYRYEKEGVLLGYTLVFHRRELFQKRVGEQVTDQDLMDRIETNASEYPAARYRIVPTNARLDFTTSTQVYWP